MKKMIIAASVVACALALGGVATYAGGQIARNYAIDKNSALNFACIDANILPEEAQNVFTEFEFERGVFVYQMEFNANGTHYEYEIDSTDGRIIKKESEKIPGYVAETATTATNKAQQNNANTGTAKTDSADAANSKTDNVNVIAAENVRTDGTAKNEIVSTDTASARPVAQSQAQTDQAAADAQSQAAAAQAAVQPASTNTSSQGTISVEQAKSIALSKAGVSASSAVFTKAKLDRDDGRLEYEIDFYIPGKGEYDFDIDAYSGAVVASDIELWQTQSSNTTAKSSNTTGNTTGTSNAGSTNNNYYDDDWDDWDDRYDDLDDQYDNDWDDDRDDWDD